MRGRNKSAPDSAKFADVAENRGGAIDSKEIDESKYIAVLNKEREWRRMNPKLWSDIEAWALNEAKHGRKFAMQTAIERIRWKDYAGSDGRTVRVSNDFGAIWARVLIAKHPEIKPFVTMRPSVYDVLEIVA